MRKLNTVVLCAAFALGLSPALMAQNPDDPFTSVFAPVPVPVPVPELIECFIDPGEAGEPKNPYKKADGYWDQGSVGACLWVSLVNANIKAGADDTGGKFARRFRRCLARKGLPNTWRRGNITVPSAEYDKVLACKKEARATESVEIEFKSLLSDKTWEQKKQALEDALSHGGAAIVITKKGNTSHSSTVTSVDCTNNTMEVLDPNGGTYTLTIDNDGKVTNVTPAGSTNYDGATVWGVTVECKTA